MRFGSVALCVVFCAAGSLQSVIALAGTVPAPLQTEIVTALKERLGDNAAPQISAETIRQTENGVIVCGQVNSRGAPQPFYFIKVKSTGNLTGSVVASEHDRDMVSTVCDG
jgi:hypothetical protein